MNIHQPTEQEVEEAAEAIFEHQWGGTWDRKPEDQRTMYRDRARVALVAAHQTRTVTTVAELEALSWGTVVSHEEDWGFTVAEHRAEDLGWYVTGCLEPIRPEVLIPATVIHYGETE